MKDWNHDGKIDYKDEQWDWYYYEQMLKSNAEHKRNPRPVKKGGNTSLIVFFLAVICVFLCAPLGAFLMLYSIALAIIGK